MAKQIILPNQKFVYNDLVSQFPPTGKSKKKLFFQAELRDIGDGTATFGIIAYPSWKEAGCWRVGTKVSGIDTGQVQTIPLKDPIAFANNEVLLSLTITRKDQNKSKKKGKKKNPRKGRWHQFMRTASRLSGDKEALQKAEMIFSARVSENPHLEYDVSLDLGTTTLTVETKPSPPAPPEA